jgi:hypothetical protein
MACQGLFVGHWTSDDVHDVLAEFAGQGRNSAKRNVFYWMWIVFLGKNAENPWNPLYQPYISSGKPWFPVKLFPSTNPVSVAENGRNLEALL